MNSDNEKDAEIKAVVEVIQNDYPDTVDFNSLDNDYFELLDANDKQIAVVTERQMTRYWNLMEGG